MPSDDALAAARVWLEEQKIIPPGRPSDATAVGRLAEFLEGFARDWRGDGAVLNGRLRLEARLSLADEEDRRADRAEELLAHALEIATTADEERQSEILRRWGLRLGASTPLGALGRLLTERLREDGSVVEIACCEVCAGQGNFPELGHGFGLTIDCSACDGTGRVPTRRES